MTATLSLAIIDTASFLFTFHSGLSDIVRYEKGPIGEGTHTRAIINNERFLAKCNAKLDA